MLLIFSFQISLLIFNTSLTRPHQYCGVLLVLIRYIENLGKYLSGVQRTVQEKDFEVILTIKMATRHPIGPFESEFPAICNHCDVMTA